MDPRLCMAREISVGCLDSTDTDVNASKSAAQKPVAGP